MKRRGSIVLSLLVVLMLSMLITGLLQSSLFHLKVYRARYRHRQAVEQIRWDLYYCLHDLMPVMLRSHGESDGVDFPSESRGESRISGKYIERLLIDKGRWKKTRMYCFLSACRQKSPYRVEAVASVDRLTGEIPLTQFELLDVAKMREKEISQFSLGENSVPGPMDVELCFDSDGFLKKKFLINDSSEEWIEIRRMAGIEILDQPLPEGFYFLTREGFIPALWIQGDVDEMVFSGDDTRQRVDIVQNGRNLTMSYAPGINNLEVVGYPEIEGGHFQETIVINGSISSLRQEDPFAFHPRTEMVIMAAGSVYIDSCLASPPQESKSPLNHLTLIVSRKHFFSDETSEAEVVINASNDCTIHAGLLVQGEICVVSSLLHLEGIAVAESFSGNGFSGIRPVSPKLEADEFFFSQGVELKKNFLIHSLCEELNEE